MAERTAVANRLHPQYVSVLWEGLLNGDTGSAFDAGEYADRTVQVIGALGTGGSVTIQGSNDGATWFTLTDQTGAALTFTALGAKVAAEAPQWMRPNVTAGDGSTDFDVIMVARR